MAEGALDPGQPLVGAHHCRVPQPLPRHLATHQPQLFQDLLGRDAGHVFLPAQGVLAHFDAEVLAHATARQGFVDADLEVVAEERLLRTPDGVEHLCSASASRGLMNGNVTKENARGRQTSACSDPPDTMPIRRHRG